jgi:glycosyltransferase involved in cell wall biosynthesis
MLILSAVLPFPGSSGQQQRVYYKLKALRECFRLTFFAPVNAQSANDMYERLLTLCDQVTLLPPRHNHKAIGRIWHRMAAAAYTLRTGLKWSNYLIGEVELSNSRVGALLQDDFFDCVLFEYWHASKLVPVFRSKGVISILDMHNVLWRSYERQLTTLRWIPKWWQRWAVAQYREREERAWQQYDGVIAINRAEHAYAQERVPAFTKVFYAPMGIDLSLWPYAPEPASPPRIAYYGGLGSPHNQSDAVFCYEAIMPEIWRIVPAAELWIVGSNPPAHLRELSEKDERVKVTGYVAEVRDVLKTMSVVLCPWSGTYGFRSRLVEVMALGIPVVASPEAVHGMEMATGRGIFLEKTAGEMAKICLNLLQIPHFAREQSWLARAQVEKKFTFEASYAKLALDLLEFTIHRRRGDDRVNPSHQ